MKEWIEKKKKDSKEKMKKRTLKKEDELEGKILRGFGVEKPIKGVRGFSLRVLLSEDPE